jgi:hypothetical protein
MLHRTADARKPEDVGPRRLLARESRACCAVLRDVVVHEEIMTVDELIEVLMKLKRTDLDNGHLAVVLEEKLCEHAIDYVEIEPSVHDEEMPVVYLRSIKAQPAALV